MTFMNTDKENENYSLWAQGSRDKKSLPMASSFVDLPLQDMDLVYQVCNSCGQKHRAMLTAKIFVSDNWQLLNHARITAILVNKPHRYATKNEGTLKFSEILSSVHSKIQSIHSTTLLNVIGLYFQRKTTFSGQCRIWRPAPKKIWGHSGRWIVPNSEPHPEFVPI